MTAFKRQFRTGSGAELTAEDDEVEALENEDVDQARIVSRA